MSYSEAQAQYHLSTESKFRKTSLLTPTSTVSGPRADAAPPSVAHLA